MARKAKVKRKTKETDILIGLNIDGQGTTPQAIEDYSLIAVRY